MATKLKKYGTSVQLWPGGQSLEYLGDPFGDAERVRVKLGHGADREKRWRRPTAEEFRALRVELTAERLQSEDLYCCDSALVTDLMRGELLDGEFSYENVSNLRPDPSGWGVEGCKEWLEGNGHDLPDPNPWGMDRAALVEYAKAADVEPWEPGDSTDDELREYVADLISDDESDLDVWREAVREHADEHEAEIYEWWRVSKWLAARLEAEGECVLDNAYGVWWGRCCTGQAHIMDGSLQKVAASLVDR